MCWCVYWSLASMASARLLIVARYEVGEADLAGLELLDVLLLALLAVYVDDVGLVGQIGDGRAEEEHRFQLVSEGDQGERRNGGARKVARGRPEEGLAPEGGRRVCPSRAR